MVKTVETLQDGGENGCRAMTSKLRQNDNLLGGFNLPSEKYESQMELLFPIYIYIYVWKNNPNVPNHQPAMTIRSGYLKTCCFLDALQEVRSDFSQSVSFPAELTTLQAVFTVAYF